MSPRAVADICLTKTTLRRVATIFLPPGGTLSFQTVVSGMRVTSDTSLKERESPLLRSSHRMPIFRVQGTNSTIKMKSQAKNF